MALSHVVAIRNGLAQNIIDAITVGVGASGSVVFLAAADAVVATLALSEPAGGAPVAGVLTYDAIADDTNAVGGTIVAFMITDSDNIEVYRGNVTLVGGGGDIEMTTLTIAAAETVRVTSLTYEASL